MTRAPSRPITIGGITYPSTAAAARALGVTRQAIHSRRAAQERAGDAEVTMGRPRGTTGRDTTCGLCGVVGHTARNRQAHPIEKSP